VDDGVYAADFSVRPQPGRMDHAPAARILFWRRRRNRRTHRLAWCLARQHPEWDLSRPDVDALDIALLLVVLVFMVITALGMC
jgi:hypothetical protein